MTESQCWQWVGKVRLDGPLADRKATRMQLLQAAQKSQYWQGQEVTQDGPHERMREALATAGVRRVSIRTEKWWCIMGHETAIEWEQMLKFWQRLRWGDWSCVRAAVDVWRDTAVWAKFSLHRMPGEPGVVNDVRLVRVDKNLHAWSAVAMAKLW